MGTFLLVCAFILAAFVAIFKLTTKVQNDQKMAKLGEPTLKIADLLTSGDPRFTVKASSDEFNSFYGLAQVVVRYDGRDTLFYQTFSYESRCFGDMGWLNEDEVEYLHTIAYRILCDNKEKEQAKLDEAIKAMNDTARQKMIDSLKK